jgi:hypothetical protein
MLVAVLGGVAVAVTVRPSDSSDVSSPLCKDTSRRFLPCRFILSVLFLPSPRLSLSPFPSRYPLFLCFSVSVVSLSTQSVSLSQFPPFSVVSLLFFPLRSGAIYRGRGSGVDRAPSHRRVHVAHVATSATAPSMVANGGVACGARLLGHLIMTWEGEEETKRRKQKRLLPCCMFGGRRRRNSAASKRHRFVSLLFKKKTA